MGVWILAACSAMWLGVLTSISPCPLASNIAAISFVGKECGSAWRVLLSGIAYTIGRALTYVVLGVLLVAGILSIPGLSQFLQHYGNKLLGPILIVVGMFLLELLSFRGSWSVAGETTGRRFAKGGIVGAGVLGILFALSFCPVSAALFFGSLVPLSLQHESVVLLPSLYGFGTAQPVLVFAVIIAAGAQSLGAAFSALRKVEWWARRITGAVFVLVGIYYCLRHIWGVFS
jgi:cytochrome c biogenesis protein CcdA